VCFFFSQFGVDGSAEAATVDYERDCGEQLRVVQGGGGGARSVSGGFEGSCGGR